LQNFPERKHERECGSRCSECYLLRLSATANYACKNNFDYWTTTLTVSPHKDSRLINEIGFELSKSDLYNNSKYLPSDFKKKNGYQRSIQLSKEYELYRQNYCGCIFGKLADENFIKSKEENNYGNS
jgi:predicted adenine nucleotide alpha hydrolase (AANH) superfamily ATPase